jgi:hypothetical protein
MPEQAVLEVRLLQGLAQQGVFAQVDHPHGQTATGAPIGVDGCDLVGRERGGGGIRGGHGDLLAWFFGGVSVC